MASELWSNVLHEVKTPLTSIKEAIALLLDGRQGALTRDQHLLLTVATSNLDRLQRMLTQLLDFSRTESTAAGPKRTLADLCHVITEVSHLVQARCDQKGLRLMLRLPPKPVQLWGSRDQLGQVVLNLVDNAIKFTGRGGSITIEVEDFGEEVALRVKDTGIGIPEEEQPLLFDRFWRSGGQSDAGGHGLGLAITKEIVTHHGGQIAVQSATGQGTTLTIRLPKDVRKAKAAAAAVASSSSV